MDYTSYFRLYRQLSAQKSLSSFTLGTRTTLGAPRRMFTTTSPQAPVRDLSAALQPRRPFAKSPRPSRNQMGHYGLLNARHQSTSSTPKTSENKKKSAITGESKGTTYNQKPYLRPQGAPQDVPAPEANERGEVPAYELTFTCKPCKTRSSHRISKHGYHNGTVLITCPQCKNRHVISDHLQIFNDAKKSFDEILKEKGELLKTGVLDPDGDIELWDDGTQSSREKENGPKPAAQ